MKTLIIYDNDGTTFSIITGDYVVPAGGIQYAEIEIPEGKRFVKMDTSVSPHVPVYEEIPIDPVVKMQADLDYIAMMTGVTL